jgi:DNA polymerase I-like protein with 3'-5' exonuclease and polymerase domains
MKTVIDIETTSFHNNPSPYIPENYLVSVGFKSDDWNEYLCFKHNEREPSFPGVTLLSEQLERTTLLIGHNIKFDLSWLLECGFEYNGDIYDTMIYEYVKAGGIRTLKLNLSDCCKRRKLPIKYDTTKEYLKNGVGFESMPWDIVEEYGRNDVDITWLLYHKQQEEIDQAKKLSERIK